MRTPNAVEGPQLHSKPMYFPGVGGAGAAGHPPALTRDFVPPPTGPGITDDDVAASPCRSPNGPPPPRPAFRRPRRYLAEDRNHRNRTCRLRMFTDRHR